MTQSTTMRCTTGFFLRSKAFRRGVADKRAGRPPRFDQETEEGWLYEVGRLWAVIAPVAMPEKRNIASVIEIGRLLTDAHEQLEHGEWLPWLDREFGWSYSTARRYQSVFELSRQIHQIEKFNLSIMALYLLADLNTPEAVRQEILKIAAKERVSYSRARDILVDHIINLPTSPDSDADPADPGAGGHDDPGAGGDDPGDDDELVDPAPAPSPPPQHDPTGGDELIAALRTIIAHVGRDLAECVLRAGIDAVDLISASDFLRRLAETMRGGDQIKLAADRAEARSRAQAA